MSLREKIRNNPAIGAMIAVVLLAVAVTIAAQRGRAPENAPFAQVWFYDLNSGDLFPAANHHPPIAAPSGGKGVRAVIYACGACDPSSWQPAYLENLTDEAHAAMQQPADSFEQTQARTAAMTTGRRVAAWPRAGEKPAWIVSTRPEAAAVIAAATPRCDNGNQPQLCTP